MNSAQQIKEKAKAHFLGRGTEFIFVPQWEARIFFKTPNLSTLKSVMSEAKGDAIEAQARIVVACATDEEGQRIWAKAEYRDLMTEYDPGAVALIANAIMAKSNLDLGNQQLAEDEKN